MANDLEKTSNSVEAVSIADTVDDVTRARVGSLAAHGVPDTQIADVLLLSVEQILACKGTDEYRKKYSEEAQSQIQDQIDRDEGWDAVETKALEQVFETLKYNRDPRFALAAAAQANKADRRTRNTKGPHVIDNSNQTTNVIVLNLNKSFVGKASSGEIDITPQNRTIEHHKKIVDMPTPKMVGELLAPVTETPKKQLSEIEEAFKNAGVVFDIDE